MSKVPPPSQEVLRATCLRPGRPVDLILQTDLHNNLIDVRPTVLHDVDPKGRLVLAQTQPLIKTSFAGRALEITFLARYHDVPGSRWLRVGYVAELLGVLDNYQLGPGHREQVLLAPGPKKLSSFTLRLDYRLEPTLDNDLRLCFWPDRTPLQIVDISAGGVRFSHSASWSFTPRQKLNIALESHGETLVLAGRVKRSGEPEGPATRGLRVTAVQFEEMELAARQRLSQLIQEALRIQIAKRSGFSNLRSAP
jgi:hypothetical protein